MFAPWCAAHDGPAAPADVTPPHLSGFFRDLLADGAASSANTRYWQLRAGVRAVGGRASARSITQAEQQNETAGRRLGGQVPTVAVEPNSQGLV
jgi:hypothetical protein